MPILPIQDFLDAIPAEADSEDLAATVEGLYNSVYAHYMATFAPSPDTERACALLAAQAGAGVLAGHRIRSLEKELAAIKETFNLP